MEFGSNLNAYTSIDQTVYRICDVPTARQTALDSCLLVLKDWSCGLLLEDEEIDKERGVIHQEWQMGSDPFQLSPTSTWRSSILAASMASDCPSD